MGLMAKTLSPRDVLRTLVGFDTVSSKTNRALINWISDYLLSSGAHVEVLSASHDDKANLFATIGPNTPGGIVLSGHTDVVPVEGQAWDSDPFELVERNGKLFGRGTADMKSFVALAVALAPYYASLPLRRPIHFAFSYDEEVGCLGAPDLVQRLSSCKPVPEIAIIGEPTRLNLVNGHKGCDLFTLEIKGKEAHSSAPALGTNAILYAMDFVDFLRSLFTGLEREGAGDDSFDPPYSTFNIGRIEGGEAVNIIASSCRVIWEFRTVPGNDTDEILRQIEAFVRDDLEPRLRQAYPDGAVSLERFASVPMLTPEPNGAAETLVRHLTGQNSGHTVAFGSEAGLFQSAGLSAVLCGPGDIAQAHQPNEFITLEQFEAGEAFLRRVGDWATSSAS